jgi:hypothetical protein
MVIWSSTSCLAQVSFTSIPLDKQLFGRSLETNEAVVLVSGQVEEISSFDAIELNVFREVNGSKVLFQSMIEILNYSLGMANFEFEFSIIAELANYSVELNGKIQSVSVPIDLPEGRGKEFVAGDVYIINGQSNAEAKQYDSSDSSSGFQDPFIRVFERGSVDVSRNKWFTGQGDFDGGINGNTGQWGLRLAKKIIDEFGIPVAIFNGSTGGSGITVFERPTDYKTSISSNYGRLYYRLNYTGLRNHVRAILWSQEENATAANQWKSKFFNLRMNWYEDYPSLEHIYIFQTRNGCGVDSSNPTVFPLLNTIKESQRQLAIENDDITLMVTDGIQQYSDNCHFPFTEGYEQFAMRIFPVIKTDLYGGMEEVDIKPPNLLNAYLVESTKLIIETDSKQLVLDESAQLNLIIHDINGSKLTDIDNIVVNEGEIIVQLTSYPGTNPLISNYGNSPGSVEKYIFNSTGLELVNFYEYQVDTSRFTEWDGSLWSNGVPNESLYAIFRGNYDNHDFTVEAKDLTIKDGVVVNFDSQKTSQNSIVVYGDLYLQGNLIIGDYESLVMINDNSEIFQSGTFTKLEDSQPHLDQYDITYWSSPVEAAQVGDVFMGVNPSRIYELNPFDENPDPNFTGEYEHWFVATGSTSMAPGKGYAAEGIGTGIQSLSFNGIPNNGNITVPLFYDAAGAGFDNWNLIGNPYPSAIDIDSWFSTNGNVSAIFLWTHATAVDVANDQYNAADYVTYNGSGSNNPDVDPNIGSGQGFMVETLSSGDALFTNNMRLADANDQFFKSDKVKTKLNPANTVSKNVTDANSAQEEDRMWLSVINSNGVEDRMLIGFFNEATDDFDKRYDSRHVNLWKETIIYSILNDQKLSIQGLGSFDETKTVSIGIDTSVESNLTIAIDKTEGALIDAEVFLVDNYLNIRHDLNFSEYTIENSEIGQYADRFTLEFRDAEDISDDQEIEIEHFLNIYQNSEELQINSSRLIRQIKVYDIMGRIIAEKSPSQKSTILTLPGVKSTILLLEVRMENGYKFHKKIISYQ